MVNTRTHQNRPAAVAQLRGWRRGWRTPPGSEVAVLTALPDPEAEIEGLVAAVAPADWAALHAREAHYDLHDVSTSTRHDTGTESRIGLYAVPDRHGRAAAAPILLSYLDVVAQGYLDHFGPEGLARFVETTEGWETPVTDDRAAPRYPRAQPLADDTRAAVDALLSGLGARILRG
ncbi:gamma-glutamylcyclotransferase [Roseivivax jejudonensis]|uniref:gamma-glutamylcyclotransferase n=1 Tax=Roseivivax jejudonensis TaxID=1529041 RepID=UPI001F336379|nr:gamma-glutamylcyclotransferase [Roseivivax jejudonensis]